MAWHEPPNSDNSNNNPDPKKDRKPNPDSWGRDSSGPPDLDELIRNSIRRIQRLVKGKKGVGNGGGGSGGGDNSNSSFNNEMRWGVGIIAAVILGLWALSGIFIVDPAEQAVILRFGRYVSTVGPGPHWMARFIEKKYMLNTQSVSNFTYTALMLNKDENIVSVNVAVQYKIGNPNDYLFGVVNPLESLQQATASALRQVVGHTTLDDILTVGREKVRQQLTQQLRDILALYRTGIVITDVTLQPAKAPEEVREAFDDAIKAQEDELRYKNQAQAYAARVKPIAEGQAQRILQEAQAYRDQVILQARGEVSRFNSLLVQYLKAPAITRERLYLEAIQTVLSHTTKIIVDVKNGNNFFSLPLDKVNSTLSAAPANVKPPGKPGEDATTANTATADPNVVTSGLSSPFGAGSMVARQNSYMDRPSRDESRLQEMNP